MASQGNIRHIHVTHLQAGCFAIQICPYSQTLTSRNPDKPPLLASTKGEVGI